MRDFQLSQPVSEPSQVCPVPGWCNQSVQLASLTLIQQTKEDLLEPSNNRRSSAHVTSQSLGSAMNPENALELLGPGYSNPLVRKYAVFRLKQADDEELELYLLQLVQALRYENLETIKEGLHIQLMEFYDKTFASNFNEEEEEEEDPMEQMDLIRCHSCPHLFGKAFEQRTQKPKQRFKSGPEVLFYDPSLERLLRFNSTNHMFHGTHQTWRETFPSGKYEGLPVPVDLRTDLSTFLIDRCCGNFKLANYLYWYLMVECESIGTDINIQEMFLIVLKRFLMRMEHTCPEWNEDFQQLQRQYHFVQRLTDVVTLVQQDPSSRPKKEQLLKEQLVAPRKDIGFSFADFDPIPLPIKPDKIVDGILPGKTEIYKSAMLPSKFVFRQSDQQGYVKVIFKVGNDLRQDQFALQMIDLFNKLFLSSGLDLHITPYKVLATSTNSGFVEYIESQSVANIISENGSILKYFQRISANRSAFKAIISTFARSCAAYCVMTYILAVGDRHLDNLLITPSGALFHVDFAFIFGRDPKPLPPPMKLTKEMIEAMGGSNSATFHQFRRYCHTAYLVSRRNSELILSLLSLMSSSSIPSLVPGSLNNKSEVCRQSQPRARRPMGHHHNQTETQATVIVRDRLKLDLSEPDAVKHIDHLLHLSSSAVVATFVERLHKLAQSMRA
ncbi:hypothetical protein TCAL_09234 [Tigriopus californicus]|uniref:Phosphatidylinositol 3-kinase catalytic subunit type 3 n=1 Tax=Tigriopus californicus TaxID=6832 RepID=A0A553NP69_TIGCA|nr:phosphatidylinositol 3-kinase catalytic subunit type 3-like [Tigriopus californicus]TRY67190.1 hypothetical protein TCAL_09234 [Tigriopus californicus]